MAEQQLKLFYTEPFTVRLTKQDAQFIDDNFDELFDGDKSIRPRQAFLKVCESAIYKLSKQKESLPADKELIASLEKEISDLKAKHKDLSAQFNEAVELKLNTEKKLAEALEQIKVLQENPTVQVKEIEKPVERQIDLTTERLLHLTPEESFILAIVENHHKCDATEILIKRFFNVYIQRGNGDYNIQRIAPAKLQQLKAHFKAQQNQTQQA